MNPVAFGSRDRQLFGVYQPAGERRSRRGVVLCPPFGQEHLRAHRPIRLLAEQLARRGHDVLRFDYYGTGDSSGDGLEADLDGFVADTLAAVDELGAMAGVRRFCVAGLRLGALVAARAAAESRGVDEVVLWDPVIDGARELAAAGVGADGVAWAKGFPLSDRLRSDLGSVDVAAYDALAGTRALLVVSDPAPDPALRERFENGTWDGEFACFPSRRSWEEEADLGVGAVPVEVLNHIAGWI